MFFANNSIQLADGTQLHLKIREMGHPNWLIVTHGVGEHSGRYSFLQSLLPLGPNICLYDLRGHGKSMGTKGNVESFELYSQDLKQVINFLKTEYRMESFTLYGHSLGGLIVADFLKKYSLEFEGLTKVFLSSPCVFPYGVLPNVLGHMGNSLKKLATSKMGLKLPLSMFISIDNLCHDPRIIQEYKKDPLNTHFFHTSYLFALADYAKKVWNSPLGVQVPIRASIGLEDKIVSVSAFKKYFKKYEPNAQIKLFPGAYHEMHNEILRLKRPFMEYLYEFITGRELDF